MMAKHYDTLRHAVKRNGFGQRGKNVLDFLAELAKLASMAQPMEHPIKAARKQQGLTLSRLGAAAGIHFATISKIERRKQGASIDAYRRIGKALGVDWRTLVED